MSTSYYGSHQEQMKRKFKMYEEQIRREAIKEQIKSATQINTFYDWGMEVYADCISDGAVTKNESTTNANNNILLLLEENNEA